MVFIVKSAFAVVFVFAAAAVVVVVVQYHLNG